MSAAGDRVELPGPGPGRHLPSLDGLRACAIIFVLLAHLTRTSGFPFLLPPGLGDIGNLGVRIFFVLSGFLITHLLIREEERSGTISLRKFYLRRALRIFPAFYVFLLALWLASRVGWLVFPLHDQITAATYTTNFARDRSWYIGHTWSLAVEEQFYLLWPGAYLLAGRRHRLTVVVAVLAFAPAARLATWMLWPSSSTLIGEAFPTIMDAIATGAALALLRQSLHATARYQKLLTSPWLYGLPVLIILVNAANGRWFRPGLLLGETVLNTLIALGIDRALTHPRGAFGRILNWQAMTFVGVLSYSLYLWQQPFMVRYSQAFAQRFPWNLVFAITAALASHFIVERPFLQLKERLARGRSAPVSA